VTTQRHSDREVRGGKTSGTNSRSRDSSAELDENGTALFNVPPFAAGSGAKD
jgi:hypothetical protein